MEGMSKDDLGQFACILFLCGDSTALLLVSLISHVQVRYVSP